MSHPSLTSETLGAAFARGFVHVIAGQLVTRLERTSDRALPALALGAGVAVGNSFVWK